MNHTPRRYITLGDGTRVTLAEYSAAWRACTAASPGTEFRRGLCGYGSRTREVNTPRLAVRWVPRDFEERLRHRVRRYEDD